MKLRRLFQISLFWRTFVLLMLLILASSLVWYISFKLLEADSRAQLSARQISSAVNLTRSSLVHADAIYRTALIKNISDQEGLFIRPREPADKISIYVADNFKRLLQLELQKKLGGETIISDRVNGVPGLWVSFSIQGDQYWLQTDPVRIEPTNSEAWLYWVALAIAISLIGALAIGGLLNRPLKQLSQATTHVRMGHFDRVKLSEKVFTTEIHQVNRGFNKMTAQLSKIEIDRTVMLAGISHDLRTPLARLRLETELSVSDSSARAEMSQDIEQINAILGKFLDYARPHVTQLQVVNLASVVTTALQIVSHSAKDAQDISVEHRIAPDLQVMADPIELQRVITNLLENARRYGKSTIYPEDAFGAIDAKIPRSAITYQEPSTSEQKRPNTPTFAPYSPNSNYAIAPTNEQEFEQAWSPTRLFEEPIEVAKVEITASIQDEWVLLTVRDHGSGVSPDVLSQLNVPFFRANQARTNTTGTGLGLAIVEKAIQGMQGKLKLSNWGTPHFLDAETAAEHIKRKAGEDGGFVAEISLKRPAHKLAAQKTA
jgi:two-component system, OmpR family, osmolarity sensor histidine kinase EnvZ